MVKHLARLVTNGQGVRTVPTSAGVQPSRMSRMDIDE
jgi:hypothetical protein